MKNQMRPSVVTTYRAEYEARLSSLDPIQRDINRWMRGCMVDEKDCFSWKLVATEAVTNAIRHGCAGVEYPSIAIRVEFEDSRMRMAISQPGPGPAPERIEQATLPDDPFSEGGRGLFIIREFADRLEHWSGPDGYCLVIHKSLETPPRPPLEQESESILSELTSAYESLSAYNRLGQQLLDHASLCSFIGETLTSLRIGHPFCEIRICPSSSLPPEMEEECHQSDADFQAPSLKWKGDPSQMIWDQDSGRPQLLIHSEIKGTAGIIHPVFCQDMHLFDAVATFDNPEAMTSPVVNLFISIADLLGLATGLAILKHQREAEARRQREWEIATQLQLNLLPMNTHHRETGLRIGFFHESAGEVAGDYAMLYRSSMGPPLTYLTVIDVMGKGVRAALLAILFRGVFLLLARQGLGPAEILQTANRLFCTMLGDQVFFVTAVVCRFDMRSRRVDWSNAGHCDLIGIGSDILRQGPPSGPPIGIMEDSQYIDETWELDELDRLALYTDGCYEWKRNGELFETENFKDFLRQRRQAAPDAAWNELIHMIKNTADSDSHVDDVTLVLCSFK